MHLMKNATAELEAEVDTGVDARIEKVMDSVLRLHKIRDHNPRHDSSLEQKDGDFNSFEVRRACGVKPTTHTTRRPRDVL